mmetsp:Transcript_35543/g.83008  ORF Transcript_35543/g.83008 Transcript_35543/m.83008 type:complete len:133 (+) Transcript_35543:52-450(+)
MCCLHLDGASWGRGVPQQSRSVVKTHLASHFDHWSLISIDAEIAWKGSLRGFKTSRLVNCFNGSGLRPLTVSLTRFHNMMSRNLGAQTETPGMMAAQATEKDSRCECPQVSEAVQCLMCVRGGERLPATGRY